MDDITSKDCIHTSSIHMYKISQNGLVSFN